FLRHARVHAVDMLMISHSDMDHMGGATAITRRISVRSRVGAGSDSPCRAGQSWRWDGVTFRVVHPPPAHPAMSDNNASCVLRVAGLGGVALLPGDIEADAEQVMINHAGTGLNADIVVVPHHGSDTSSSVAFVAATSPQYALVSSGWHNQWHFPRAVVVHRY